MSDQQLTGLERYLWYKLLTVRLVRVLGYTLLNDQIDVVARPKPGCLPPTTPGPLLASCSRLTIWVVSGKSWRTGFSVVLCWLFEFFSACVHVPRKFVCVFRMCVH